MQRMRFFYPVWAALLCFGIVLGLVLGMVETASAQNGLLDIKPGKQTDSSQKAKTDPQALRQSLDDVIQTLENDDRRTALLEQLKSLRTTASAEAAGAGSEGKYHGLLGALADSLQDLGEQAENEDTPADLWLGYARDARADLRTLFAGISRTKLLNSVAQTALALGVWLGSLLVLTYAGHVLFARRGWPLVLPPEPRPWLLLAHFLRRVLPWLLTFAWLLISLRSLDTSTAARVIVLVVAYVTLCARVLTSVFDIVVSLFTSGHRQVAVAILHNKALRPLFAVGALVALSDAVDSQRLTDLLGAALAGGLSVSASLIAALLSGWLVLRVRRPVEHLIRNRSYSQRRDRSVSGDMVGLLGRLWHIPILLVIGASVLAIVLAGGGADIAFAKSVVCAVLLVLALVLTGLLRRQHAKPTRRRRMHKSRYVQRLFRFGYTLTHCVIWAFFAELSLQVWGVSLVGIGQPDALSPRIGRTLLAIAVTGLLAWLLWIFADTALERAVSGGSRNRRKATARAQTMEPLLRNTIFVIILTITGIVTLANLGVNVTPLLAGAGIIGLAVGFGAQNLVQDLITGIFILVEDSLAVGDFVEINGHMGTVEGLNLRTVRLRDLDGILHFITFSHISSIHNMSRQFGIALLKIRIPADLPIDDAVTLMRETAVELRKGWRMGRLIRSPLEMQGIHAFEDGCPILRMRMRTAPEYQWDVARAFNLLLKQRMEAQHMTLGAPRISLHMEAGGNRQDGGEQDATSKQQETPDPSGPQPDPG